MGADYETAAAGSALPHRIERMSGPHFDHEAERKSPLSTGFVAAALIALGALGTAWWVAASASSARRAAQAARATTARDGTALARTPGVRDESTALIEAAGAGDVELAGELLAHGADANAHDAAGRSALSAALAAG